MKCYVYVLKNRDSPPKYYTGLTSDVARRLAEHNGDSRHRTARYRPWDLDVVVEFADERRAVVFERHLKSGSGVAFAQRGGRNRMPQREFVALVKKSQSPGGTSSPPEPPYALTRAIRLLLKSA